MAIQVVESRSYTSCTSSPFLCGLVSLLSPFASPSAYTTLIPILCRPALRQSTNGSATKHARSCRPSPSRANSSTCARSIPPLFAFCSLASAIRRPCGEAVIGLGSADSQKERLKEAHNRATLDSPRQSVISVVPRATASQKSVSCRLLRDRGSIKRLRTIQVT